MRRQRHLSPGRASRKPSNLARTGPCIVRLEALVTEQIARTPLPGALTPTALPARTPCSPLSPGLTITGTGTQSRRLPPAGTPHRTNVHDGSHRHPDRLATPAVILASATWQR